MGEKKRRREERSRIAMEELRGEAEMVDLLTDGIENITVLETQDTMTAKGIKKERKDHVLAKKNTHLPDPPGVIAEEVEGGRGDLVRVLLDGNVIVVRIHLVVEEKGVTVVHIETTGHGGGKR